MKKVVLVMAALALLRSGNIAQADVFNMGPGLTSLEMVTVGDPGNVADTRYATPGYGSVGYTYNIGKYEVTAAQYTDFLNRKARSDPYGLYSEDMAIGDFPCGIIRSGPEGSYTYSVAAAWANRPVNYVSFWDAARFANWLDNGQADGDTETGAYTLNGYTGSDGHEIQRNAGAGWFVTSGDEWYKAAYYQGAGAGDGYWDYPTQADRYSIPGNHVTDPDPGNSANFYKNGAYSIGAPYFRTDAGEFENSGSAYGTFDQGGNVQEWSETVVKYTADGWCDRAVLGGSFYHDRACLLASRYNTDYAIAWDGYAFFGFRVASVPEPSSMAVVAGFLAAILSLRRRGA